MTTDPFERLNTKRITGARKAILGIGDSTFIGYGSGNDGGWLTRLAIKIGIEDNCDVYWCYWNEQTGWSSWIKIHTGTSGAAPLYLYVGAMGGHDLLAMYGWLTDTRPPKFATPPIATGYVAEQPDLIFQGSVVNDCVQPADNATGFPAVSISTYISRYDAVIGQIQSKMPGVPAVVVTQNAWQPLGLFSSDSTFVSYQAAEAAHIGIPNPTIPFSPALQQSTTASNLWMMDTRQAIPGGWNGTAAGDDWADQYHLRASGNQKQADWVYGYIASSMTALTLPPTITTTSLEPVVRGVPFEQTINVTGTGVSVSIVGQLPRGLSFDPATRVLSGTPTSFGGTYAFTVHAANASGAVAEHPFSGEIDRNAGPWVGDRIVKPRLYWRGHLYPVKVWVMVDGELKLAIPRK